MGRQLGLMKDELFQLALSGLLIDIGKLNLPDHCCAKPPILTRRRARGNRSHIQTWPSHTARPAAAGRSASAVRHHHERFNGCGYPNQLAGTDIPLYARIAGIVDCYDAMTSPRYYATPIPHSEAILKLAGWRSRLFQKELVDTFIQAIGLYPPGSLVELTNGEVAVVSDYKAGMGRKPKLTIILDVNKRRLSQKKVLSLSGKEGTIDIARNLPPDAYNWIRKRFFAPRACKAHTATLGIIGQALPPAQHQAIGALLCGKAQSLMELFLKHIGNFK